MTPFRIGLLAVARSTFDVALATEITTTLRQDLRQAGFELAGPETLLLTPEEMGAAALSLAADPPDLLLLLQATFTDSTMAVELARTVKAPLLLWAIPEARTGGRLHLNSLCGINLAGHALRRAGYRYDYLYTIPGDPAALAKVATLAQAGSVYRRLHQARLGIVGEHPAGFDSCRYDPAAIRAAFGLETVPIPLGEVFEAVRAVEPAAVDQVLAGLKTRLPNLAGLDQAALRKTLGTYVTLRRTAGQEGLSGFAVRCWPEFFTELGGAACGAMSMLSDEAIPCSCEADVNGTITQLILQWLSGQPAFGSDLVAVDGADDVAVLWHCGLAPLGMADPAVQPAGTIHAARKLPFQMEFALKPGRVTVARLSEATGSYRLVVAGAEMVAAPRSFTGTNGVLRFDRPAREVLDTILREGLEHHISLTYGDHIPALLALAAMLNLPVLHLA